MIVILVGLVGSGKSTLCQKYAKEGFLIIGDDALYMSLHAGQYDLYKEDLKPLYKAIETSMISKCLLAGQSIVIDRPNIKKDTRQRYIQLAKSFDMECHALVFPIVSVEEHAKRRFYSDARGLTLDVWIKACEGLMKEYQPPSLVEGFNSIEEVK